MDKLREMILYAAERRGIHSFEELCSILYLTDFQSYLRRGESISGSIYIRGRKVPEPKGIRELLLDMQSKKEIDFTENFLK